MGSHENEHINLKNARLEQQIEVMKRIDEDGVCPFCHDFVEKKSPTYHGKPILYENEAWVATENKWPYDNSQFHILLILKRHITDFIQLNETELKLLRDIVDGLVHKYQLKHYSLVGRSADTEYTGATVTHLHLHLIVAKGEDLVVVYVG